MPDVPCPQTPSPTFLTFPLAACTAPTASPIRYVSPDDPPFLIMHGDSDHAVPLTQSQTLARALQEAGVPVELVVVHHAGHGFAPQGGSLAPNQAEITRRIVAFFQEWLR